MPEPPPLVPPVLAGLTLTTLGSAALHRAGERAERSPAPSRGPAGEVLLPPGKPLALVTYLALASRRTATRDHLLDLLWGDLGPEKARHALRQTLWYLRQLLGADSLIAIRGGEITLALPLTCDRDEFLAALDAGDLERAMTLYGGSFLGEFAVPGGVEFEHWADVERQRLRAAFLRGAETLTRRHLAAGQYREAQQLARRARDQARSNEALWRLLLEAYAQGGDHLGFAMEASSLSLMLSGEGRVPEPPTRALLRRLEVEDRAGSGPGEESRALVGELVGREREFATLVQCWQGIAAGTGHHVHITAPAGIGKTRLLEDLHDRLRAFGARVVSVRANPGESGISYAFLAQLATQLAGLPGAAAVSPATAGTLVALSPTLSSRYSAAPDPATGDEALRRRTAALTELLTVVGDERPMALLLDDMHWLDPASRPALRSLVERIGDSRVLVVTASRLVGPQSVAGASSTVLPLQPLSPIQILALVGSLGTLPDEPWGRALPEALAAATAGSPLLILGTLQLALEEGWLALVDGAWRCADPAALSLKLRQGSALRHRAGQLDAEGQRLLLTLALAGMPLPARLLATASGLPLEAASASLLTLEQRGFVHQNGAAFQPAHDELALATCDIAEPATVEALHAGLGRALAALPHADPGDLVRAGHHLLLAGHQDDAAGVFTRYLTRLRRLGDGRRVTAIASEFLGEGTPLAEVDALLRHVPPWTRLLHSSGRSAVLLAAVAVVLGASTLYSALHPPEPELTVVALELDSTGRLSVATAPVSTGAAPGSEPLQLIEAPDDLLPMPLRAAERERLNGVRPSPDFRTVAYGLTVPKEDSGVIDLFISGRQGYRRLTTAPRDDGPLGWSPDGRQLLGYSARWSPPGYDDYDLALVDTASGALTRLTYTRDADHYGSWSPDGQRIVFLRVWKTADRGNSVCWIAPAPDQVPVCTEPRGAELVSGVAWLDNEHVLVQLDSAASLISAALDLQRGEWRRLPLATVTTVKLDPEGERALLDGVMRGSRKREWYLTATARLDRGRPLRPSRPDRRIVDVFWRARNPGVGYVDTLLIANPATSMSINSTARPDVVAKDPRGVPVFLPATLRWSSSDTSVLTVSPRGVVRAVAAGEATITAEIPGWRAVRQHLWVRGDSASVVLEEPWDSAWAQRWIVEGDPRPRVETGPGGRRGLLNNGDGSYASGVLSPDGWDPSGGLGLELYVSTPVDTTQNQFQQLSVSLIHPIRADFQTPFDTATQTFEALSPGDAGLACGFAFPAGEGRLGTRRLVFIGTGNGSGIQTEAGRWMRTGAWWRARVQLLPDGRCAVAVNGVPVWLSGAGTRLDMRWRISLGLASKNALMLHGPLQVWQGVPDDIDWSVLDTLNSRPLPLADEPRGR